MSIAADKHGIEVSSIYLVRAVVFGTAIPALSQSGRLYSLSESMGTVTPTATAAFMFLALENDMSRSGVYCPEGWIESERFYRVLDR